MSLVPRIESARVVHPRARLVLPKLRWLALALLVVAHPALAQPMGEVVVVPFGVPDLTAPLNVTSLLESELVEQRVSLIPMHDARDRFTARSRPPQTASDSDLDVLAREARQAIEHVAFGRTAAAQKSVREVIARAERTLESLNRETATARNILDACLSLVRTTLQTGRRDLALEQATRCRRLVPDLTPSEDNHPAAVVGVLAEADNMLRRMRIGHLVVRSTPESNCSVYLNGRHLGTTPFQLDRAAAGDYRVQVECGRSVGRVHVVQLGDQAVSLLVDTQFDRTVASDPRILLRYENRDRAREQAVSHAIQIGRDVQADDVILIGVHHDRAELLRVRISQERLVARASVPWSAKSGFAKPALDAAIVALSEGRFEGEPSLEKTSSQPTPPKEIVEPRVAEPEQFAQAAPQAPEPQARPVVSATPAPTSEVHDDATPPSARRRRRVRIAGYSLAGASVALFAVGIGYDVKMQKLLDQLATFGDDVVQSGSASTQAKLAHDQSKYDSASHLHWIGVAGGVLGTAASALLVEPRGAVPWWGYAFGAGAVGLIVGGAYDLAHNGDCDLVSEVDVDGQKVHQCRRPHETRARGAMLISAALPFLTVPVVQLFKPRADRALAFTSGATYNGFTLQLQGRF